MLGLDSAGFDFILVSLSCFAVCCCLSVIKRFVSCFLCLSHVLPLVNLRSCHRRVMRVEPLPDIRGGILVERLVKTVRYVADMRRCQYVVQRPEGVRR